MSIIYVNIFFLLFMLSYTCTPVPNSKNNLPNNECDEMQQEVNRVEQLFDDNIKIFKDSEQQYKDELRMLKTIILDKFRTVFRRAFAAEQKLLTFAKNEGFQLRVLNECEELALDLMCGKKLHFSMKFFGLEYGVREGDIFKCSDNLKKAFDNIYRRINDKRITLQFCAISLQKLCNEYISKPDSFKMEAIRSTWDKKVMDVFNKLRKEHINRRTWTSSEQPKNLEFPQLSDLVAEFYYAGNATNSVEIFHKQCSQGFWLRNEDRGQREQWEELDELVVQWSDTERNEFIPDIKIGNKIGGKDGVEPQEHGLISDLLVTGKYFINKDKHFRHCIEVFYLGEIRFINKMVQKMKKRWDGEVAGSFMLLVDRFCSSFQSLYNIIKAMDIHAPPQSCTPNSTHYQRYVGKISSTPDVKKDYIFIAEILGLIDAPPEE